MPCASRSSKTKSEKWVDRCEGVMLRLIEAKQPVAFFANGIGDTFLSLPALRALAKLFSGRLSLVCNGGSYRLCLSELSLRGVVMPWSEGPDKDRLFAVAEVADAIAECDLFLSLVPWHSNSMKGLLDRVSPTTSVGFFPDFDVVLPRNHDKHSSELAFDVPRIIQPSLRLDDYAEPPRFSPEAEREVRRLRSLVPTSWRRMLAVHTDTLPEKMWELEGFLAVLDAFLQRHPDFMVFSVGTSGQPLDRVRYTERVIPCYDLPLDVACCLVSQADLFLGVDSCMLHVADLFRVPGVGLFGPTSCSEFGFRFSHRHRHVCGGDRRMNTIDPQTVLESLESLL